MGGSHGASGASISAIAVADLSPVFTPATRERQADVRTALRSLLERGKAAGELRADLSPEDLIVATSLLCRPLPGTGDWDGLARRQIELMINGLGPTAPLGSGLPS